ncbi:hypothetical protein WN943_013615 [Citrus x changshan-huyou]
MALSASHVGAMNGVQLLWRRSGAGLVSEEQLLHGGKGGEEQMARNVEVSDYLVMVICAWLHLLNVSPASLFSLFFPPFFFLRFLFKIPIIETRLDQNSQKKGEKEEEEEDEVVDPEGEMKGRRASYLPHK